MNSCWNCKYHACVTEGEWLNRWCKLTGKSNFIVPCDKWEHEKLPAKTPVEKIPDEALIEAVEICDSSEDCEKCPIQGSCDSFFLTDEVFRRFKKSVEEKKY